MLPSANLGNELSEWNYLLSEQIPGNTWRGSHELTRIGNISAEKHAKQMDCQDPVLLFGFLALPKAYVVTQILHTKRAKR
jgi:hypothetical protein